MIRVANRNFKGVAENTYSFFKIDTIVLTDIGFRLFTIPLKPHNFNLISR